MGIEKRGICKIFVILLALFVFLVIYASPIMADGYCANPLYGSQGLCEDEVEFTDCCPDDEDEYPDEGEGWPDDQEDCEANYFSSSKDDLSTCEQGSCYVEGDKTCSSDVYLARCYYDGGEPNPGDGFCEEGCCCYEAGGEAQADITIESYCENADGNFDPDITDSTECAEDVCELDEADEGDASEGDSGGDEPSFEGECDGEDPCGEEELEGSCCCDGVVCGEGEYCCNGSCYSVPCDEACDSRVPCDAPEDSECEHYRPCLSNGTLGECQPDPSCADGVEFCDTPEDDNNDGKTNCEDPFCSGQVCAREKEDIDNCGEQGYYDPDDEVYRCCYGAEVNDCHEGVDGPDTCGTCDCLDFPHEAELTNIEVKRGESDVTVRWEHGCEGVDFLLKRCDGEDCEDDDYRLKKETEKEKFVDKDIDPNTKYCYKVDSVYPDGETLSSEEKCFTSGDAVCMEIPDSTFCLDAEKGFTDKMVLRAACYGNNTLEILKNCEDQYDEDYMCTITEENNEQTTQCVYQSPCTDCGNPFGMFSDYDSSTFDSPDGSEKSCKEEASCFYDYTDTTIDNFRGCSGIKTCYDYRSQGACEEQGRADGINNKCLPRNCSWQEVEGNPNGGVCMETYDRFLQCKYCNEAEHNDVFGACDADMCNMFGGGSGCYLGAEDYQCNSKSQLSCEDYTTRGACTGDEELEIDVVYNQWGNRINGTNEITTRSKDDMGLGVCKWSGNQCFNDPDGDGDPPSGEEKNHLNDVTPPKTHILSEGDEGSSVIEFEVTDFNPDGTSGSGAREIYFCKTKDDDDCYPDQEPDVFENGKGEIDIGGSTGTYNLYYYAEDRAGNLEEVQRKEIEFDTTPPEINITYDISKDTKDYDDSNITFVITTDERAYCSDEFENDPDSQLVGEEGGTTWTTKYGGLKDGYYEYKVTCEDSAGNSATEYVTPRVNADSFIFETSPSGKIDYANVDLSVKTEEEARCTWAPDGGSTRNFPSPTEKQGYYLHETDSEFELEESGTHSFDIVCEEGDRESEDEIQFVYDDVAPETTVLGTDREPFNFSDWYKSKDNKEFFLECNDSPANGFGCNNTLYCFADDECDPDQALGPSESLVADYSDESFMVCYRAAENKLDGMGGKFEDTQCQEIRVDKYPPQITLDGMEGYKNEDNPKEVEKPVLELEGTVSDQDAQSNPNNMVDIEVYDGNESTDYEGISANSEFSESIQLQNGTNEIIVTATDRSGESSSKTYYVDYTPYTDDKIFLERPRHGVAGSEEFDLIVETYADADCKYSFRGDKSTSIGMSKYSDAGKLLHRSNNKIDLSNVGENSRQIVTVFCDFELEGSAQREFELSYDLSNPTIEKVKLERAIQDNPPLLVEYPLESNLIVETDDPTICKYTDDASAGYYSSAQNKFDGYDAKEFNKTSKVMLDDLEDGESYKYYIKCENGVSDDSVKFSGKKTIEFVVDTSQDPGFRLENPEDPTSETDFELIIRATKASSECEFTHDENTHAMEADGNYSFHKNVNASHGENEFEIECITSEGLANGEIEIMVDTTAPSAPSIDDGNESVRNDSLSASWNAEDEETDIERYQYSIGSTPGGEDIVSWQNTTDNNAVERSLNLTYGETYYWTVRAENEVGLWGDENVSNGVYLKDPREDGNESGNESDNVGSTDLCANNKTDNNETDEDCGGPNCDPCPENKSCELDSDCLSNNCADGVCEKGTCSDDIQNQDETDVDCGGSCEPCKIEKKCTTDKDCETGNCEYGYCEEERDENATDSDKNGTNETCTADGGEMAGELDSDCDGMPDEWEALYGLDPHNKNDANLDANDNGKNNLQEYLDGTNPLKAEEKEEESSYWLLFLIIILIILALFVICVLSYKYFYYNIPPKYRKYTDVVVQPIARKMGELKDKLMQVYNKLQGGSAQPPQGPASRQQPQQRKAAAFTSRPSTPATRNARGSTPSASQAIDYDTQNTKEMVEQIRRKRKMEKEKEREQVISQFDEKKKPKKKDLLKKVQDAFGGENK